ncbi:Muc22p [Lambiella insularis]|nr:Muc22p [Lambiella insularis]
MKLFLLCLNLSVVWAVATPTTTHRVTVGNDGKLLYDPTTVFANVGEQVQFEFYPQNHTVTQSGPTTPCVPLAGGFFSGFIYEANETTTAATTFVLTINSTQPLYFYSSQGNECQVGMVGVIIINSTNATSQSAYASLAANATSSSAPPTAPMGGVLETVATLSNDTTTTLISTASRTPVPSTTLVGQTSTANASTTVTVMGTTSMTVTPAASGGGTATSASAAASTSAAAGRAELGWGAVGMGLGAFGAGWAWAW